MAERRIVTKGSDDGTFKKGDHIILYENGDIGCIEAKGWIPAEEVPSTIIGMEHEIDVEFLEKRKEKLLNELNSLKK